MSEKAVAAGVQGVFGALLGGMIASFVGLGLVTFMSMDLGWSSESVALVSSLVGLTFAVVFMIAGLAAVDRLAWLGGALLFASGFTTIWSAGMSLTTGRQWIGLVALGVAIAIGVTIGWRRFGREPKTAASAAAADARTL
jgi:hypothetical protein